MTFPTNLTSAVDLTTEIVAAHLNNLEAKVGIDSSAVATSLDYLLKNASSLNPGHKHTHEDAFLDQKEIIKDAIPLPVADGGTGVKTLAAGCVKADGTSAFTSAVGPTGAIVGTTDDQTLTTKELTEPQLTAQAMIAETSGNEGKVNYANDADRKAVGGRGLEIIVKSPDDNNYFREILSNRQGCINHLDIIAYP